MQNTPPVVTCCTQRYLMHYHMRCRLFIYWQRNFLDQETFMTQYSTWTKARSKVTWWMDRNYMFFERNRVFFFVVGAWMDFTLPFCCSMLLPSCVCKVLHFCSVYLWCAI